VLVHTQPDLDDKKSKAVLMEKKEEIQGLTTEKDCEVGALKNQFEVRNISMYKVHGNS
jgi:hypothetical protein